MSTSHYAIIPAAGSGLRMQEAIPKQYLRLNNRYLIDYTLAPFMACSAIKKVVVVLAKKDEHWQHSEFAVHPRILTTQGGATRAESVLNGLNALNPLARDADWAVVHDAARPCLTPANLSQAISVLTQKPAGGLLGIPVQDTLKKIDAGQHCIETVSRQSMWQAQTPQVFPLTLLKSALRAALETGDVVTDEAAAMELAGYSPYLLEGERCNIKVTRPADIPLVKYCLGENSE